MAGLLLAIAACGQSSNAFEDESPPPPPAMTPTLEVELEVEQPQPTEETPVVFEECEDPAVDIDTGTTITSEIVGDGQIPVDRKYFCVPIPDEITTITVEVTGMTTTLNLFMGYSDLKTVQEGGLEFWYLEGEGTEDLRLEVQHGRRDYVRPGLYYIEVSPNELDVSTSFTLRVDIE
jgi:hypothetical protein